MEKWMAARIGSAVSRELMSRSTLVIPCCNWTGYEADLLVVDKSLRIIDVEIKISRSDLKADLKKDKWWVQRQWSRNRWLGGKEPESTRIPREWPPKVWKHYYVMPIEIWDDKLVEFIPKTSGIVLMVQRANGSIGFSIRRRVTANKDAQLLKPNEVIDLARLGNLRMWDALARAESTNPRKKP